MGYRGGNLADLFDREPVERASRRIVERGTEVMQEAVKRRTPVRTGELRDSWYRTGPRRAQSGAGGDPALEGTVASDVKHAPFVENGTGRFGPTGAAYPIRPVRGQFLSWITTKPFVTKRGEMIPAGTRVFRKLVMHPGSPGVGMMDKAVRETEATMGAWAQPELERWAREQGR